MDFWTIAVIGLGLSMDAFAVSLSNGMSIKRVGAKEGLLIAGTFGLFQGVMPLLGYLAGQTFGEYIREYDHWIAAVLLGYIGLKMVLDAVKELRGGDEVALLKTLRVKLLLVQAVATSIDALAVGVSFAVIQVDIWWAASVIAGTTFLCCIVGVFLGKKCSTYLKQKAEIFGGAILILIGVKILLEHLFKL